MARAGAARSRAPIGPSPTGSKILELYARYQGHLVRVHEELTKPGARLSYPALTAFCRKHEIGNAPATPAGRYTFERRLEMQHDTSPHHASIGGQANPRADRLAGVVLLANDLLPALSALQLALSARRFLTDAFAYFGGSAGVCMIDNTHVVVAAGTGEDMIPAPEMAAFAERYGFVFQAHEKGDANRSARVEAPFHRIEQGLPRRRRVRATGRISTHGRARPASSGTRSSATSCTPVGASCSRPSSRTCSPCRCSCPRSIRSTRASWIAEGYVQPQLHPLLRAVSTHRSVAGSARDARASGAVRRAASGRPSMHAATAAGYARDRSGTSSTARCRANASKSQPAPEEIQMLQIEPRLGGYLTALKQQVGHRRAPLRRCYRCCRSIRAPPFSPR